MSPRLSLPSPARCLVVLALAVAVVAASAQPAAQAAPQQVTMSLDQDLITFVKAAIWVAGAFLAIFAFIAIGFFGWDVAQTRKVMQDARDDVTKRMGEIRQDHQALKDLKERLEKLGAELVEQIEKKTSAEPPVVSVPSPVQQEEIQPDEPNQDGPRSKNWKLHEAKRIHLRHVMAAAEFEWSTLGTLAKKTGLTEAEIIKLTADDPFVQRGFGRQGHVLFRLRQFNDPKKIGIGDAVREMSPWNGTTVWEHTQTGKEPIRKGE